MEKQKIKIVRKNDEYSAEYQVGDVFQVDSTWYGGVNVTSASGIPLSLDKDEYVLLEEAEKEQLNILIHVTNNIRRKETMIREVKFESQDRRIKQIIAALNANGIKDIEEANAICEAAGLDPYKTCEETQPICFENAKWAYEIGRASCRERV